MPAYLTTTIRLIGCSASYARAGPSRIIPIVHAYTYEPRRFESHSAALKRAEAARERAVQNPAFFRNDAIPYPRVRLVNAEGKLEPETKLKDLLSTIDLKSNFVQLVTIDPPDGGRPLVKVINKHEAAQKEREQKAKKKEQKKATAGQETKDIRLSWAVEPGDLKHKVVKMIQELEKKNRVNVVFVPKKGVPVPPRDQMNVRMDKVWESVKHVATEWKPRMAGDLTGSMYLQGLGKPEE